MPCVNRVYWVYSACEQLFKWPLLCSQTLIHLLSPPPLLTAPSCCVPPHCLSKFLLSFLPLVFYLSFFLRDKDPALQAADSSWSSASAAVWPASLIADKHKPLFCQQFLMCELLLHSYMISSHPRNPIGCSFWLAIVASIFYCFTHYIKHFNTNVFRVLVGLWVDFIVLCGAFILFTSLRSFNIDSVCPFVSVRYLEYIIHNRIKCDSCF